MASFVKVGCPIVLCVAWALPIRSDSCDGLERSLAQATTALDQARYTEAEGVLTGVQSSHPECHEAVLLLGRLRMGQNDTIAAQKLLSLYGIVEPQDARGYYFLSSLLFSERNYQRAESELRRALSLNPDFPDALALQGKLLLLKGQIVPAEDSLKKACQLDPKNVDAHFELGKLYDSQHKNRQAADLFEQVVVLNPDDPRAYDYLALNLDALGNAERSEWAYRKGLEVNQGPLKDSFLNYNYGRFLMAENRLREAEGHLNLAAELAPQTRAVFYERAKLNLRLRKYAEARRDAEFALKLPDPTRFVLDLQVYAQLASIYSRLGETELAAKYAKLSKETAIPLDGYRMVR
jgi:tetratricopeptide (TPR) repeat protein